VRILDRNLLVNAGFETRAPSGLDNPPPGWRLDGGARVMTEPANVRGGVRALALDGVPAEVSQAAQQIPNLSGVPGYRISVWLKTAGLTDAPTITTRFDTGDGDVRELGLSEGAYRCVSTVVGAPPSAERLTVRLQLPPGATGTAYFDDLLVEPMT
jgi:hypothetical protein